MLLFTLILCIYQITASNHSNVMIARPILTDVQNYRLLGQYKEWNTHGNSPQTIFSFNTLIQQRTVIRSQALIVQVLDACYNTKDAKFAEKLWDYIVDNTICLHKPAQMLYSKMMRVYSSLFQKGRRYVHPQHLAKSLRLTNKWIYEYQKDPESLQLFVNKSIKCPVILHQMMAIIRYGSNWTLQEQRHALNLYLRAMVALDIMPNNHTLELMKGRYSLKDCIKFVESANSSKIAHFLLERMLSRFIRLETRKWMRFGNQSIDTLQTIFMLFIQKKVVLSPPTVKLLLHACYTLKAPNFADRIWNYATVQCRVKPNQMMYSKLLMVYETEAVMSIDDVIKLIRLTEHWKNAFLMDKESLMLRNNAPLILNQMMNITVNNLNGISWQWKKSMLVTLFDTMIALDIKPDAKTIEVIANANMTLIELASNL